MNETDGKADTLGAILDDAEEVFRYRKDLRPQDRAHAYLTERRVARGFDDTAMLCVVNDLVRRAHALGVRDSKSGAARALMIRCAGELLESAEKMAR